SWRDRGGCEAKLAQGSDRLRAARHQPAAAKGARKVGGQSAALRDSGQTADAFAGEEDGEIERFGDQLSQPVERRLRIGQIEDAEHRATNGRRTLALEERCQFLKLTRF